MSTAQSIEAEEGKEDGISKYIKRMRTVLRRNPSLKPSTSSGKETAPRPESSEAAAPKPAVIPEQPTPTVFSHWGAIQEEKARILFAKYGLTLEPGEWKSPTDVTVQRVTKPIRMRVRRTCHRCQTTFGPDKVCVNCQHVRCKKCPRHPPAKPKDQKDVAETALQTILTQKTSNTTPIVQPRNKEPKLTLPSRTGGQDLVRKPVRQRNAAAAGIFDAKIALATRPSYTNIPMDTQETLSLRRIRQHGRGNGRVNEFGTHVTYVQICTDRVRIYAPIVDKKGVLKQSETRLKSKSRNQTPR